MIKDELMQVARMSDDEVESMSEDGIYVASHHFSSEGGRSAKSQSAFPVDNKLQQPVYHKTRTTYFNRELSSPSNSSAQQSS